MTELGDEMRRLSGLCDKGVTELRAAGQAVAEAEHAYRHARARAWLELDRETTTAREREDAVNAATADERRARDLAASHETAVREALRTRRQQLSAWQSLAAADRTEAELARTAPRFEP